MIRWINDKIGTASFFEIEKKLPGNIAILDVRDLVDKKGNSNSAVFEKVDEGVKLLEKGYKVIVACDYGISRSNSIAAGIIAVKEKITLEEAISEVINKTGEKEIKIEMIESVWSTFNKNENVNTEKKDILIIGGTGFIGSKLQERLIEEGISFIAPKRTEIDIENSSLELSLFVKKYSPKYIIHLANPRIYTSSIAMGKSINMLNHVLKVCVENSVCLIYPSGWEVYSGYATKEIIANTNLPLLAKDTYGLTKLLCEELINQYEKEYNYKICVLRYSPIFGENSDRPKFLYNFLDKARKNEKIITHKYKNGEPKLDLIYIDDAIEGIILAYKKEITGKYNLGSGKLFGTKYIADSIVKYLGSTSVVEYREIDNYWANISMDSKEFNKLTGWQVKTGFKEWLTKRIKEI